MKSTLVGAAALSAMLVPGLSQATTITDPAGDFLPTFVGPHNADLDILSTTVDMVGGDFVVSATLAGAVGATAGASYVFGVNTGGAGAPFAPFEPNVLFNSKIVLKANAPSTVTDNIAHPTVTTLGSGAVTVAGDTITALIPISLLPGTGLAAGQYGFSFWSADGAGFPEIADFAPNDGTFTVGAAVPEPASWAMMLVGIGGLGAVTRAGRRRRAPTLA
jgi:hypothetical protein